MIGAQLNLPNLEEYVLQGPWEFGICNRWDLPGILQLEKFKLSTPMKLSIQNVAKLLKEKNDALEMQYTV